MLQAHHSRWLLFPPVSPSIAEGLWGKGQRAGPVSGSQGPIQHKHTQEVEPRPSQSFTTGVKAALPFTREPLKQISHFSFTLQISNICSQCCCLLGWCCRVAGFSRWGSQNVAFLGVKPLLQVNLLFTTAGGAEGRGQSPQPDSARRPAE